jgi:hypothetical protein
MTETRIETLLRQAPQPAAPAELLKALREEIHLPHARSSNVGWKELRSTLRRWMPALSFGVFLLTCVILVGVQANVASQLKQQNENLRATTANLEQFRRTKADLEQRRAQLSELEQLQKDNEDLHRLRAEVEALRGLSPQIEALRAENKRLSGSLATTDSKSSDAFFDEAQQRAERLACVNNLKQVGLATRVWALDNNDRFPASLVVMSNELSTVKVLICPSDKSKQSFTSVSWSEFRDAMSSYQFFGNETDDTDPQSILSFCPIHYNFGLADGSVQQKSAHWRAVPAKGRHYMESDLGASDKPPQ